MLLLWCAVCLAERFGVENKSIHSIGLHDWFSLTLTLTTRFQNIKALSTHTHTHTHKRTRQPHNASSVAQIRRSDCAIDVKTCDQSDSKSADCRLVAHVQVGKLRRQCEPGAVELIAPNTAWYGIPNANSFLTKNGVRSIFRHRA